MFAAGRTTEGSFDEKDDGQPEWLSRFPEVRRALMFHFKSCYEPTEDSGKSMDDIKGLVGTTVGAAILYASARDAMEAFLLGGAADQALAALAEDCVRNACRKEAKDFFWKTRMEYKSGSKDIIQPIAAELTEYGHYRLPIKWEQAFQMYLPRAWTVNMYLQSFEPLDIALDVYSSLNTTGTLTMQRVHTLQHDVSESISDRCLINEIDDDDSSYRQSQIAQLVHLLPEGAVLGEQDCAAYRLLCCLVEALNYTSREMRDARVAESNAQDDQESELVYSSPALDAATSSKCGKGLMECLRLLCAHCEGVIHCSASSGETVLPGPAKLAIGVLIEVDLQSSGAAESLAGEIDSDQNAVPRLAFRLDAGLKERVRALKHRAADYDDDDSFASEENGADSCELTDDSTEEEGDRYPVSSPILSRLLSIVSSVAHLCGDDVGAHRCLSAAIALNGDNGESGDSRHSHDCRLKMACLLLEMHEFEEVLYFSLHAIDL